MRKEEAVTLVKQTLGESFDEANFKRFVTELLKDYEQKDQVREGQYVKHAFQGFVLKYKILGTFTDASGDTLDVLEVALGKSSSLELARTAQRNFVADYLKSSGRKASLVAFVRPKYDDWRLSFVKLDHTLEVVEEKLKVKQEISPARRWSFLVGKTEGSHTAQSRFTDILVAREKPTLAELQEAFSIETVTDEFFDKYKELFLQLKDHVDELIKRDEKLRVDFESKEISTADFAKKTLGQIVFLYFLQKKGWFGVAPGKPWGDGPKRFIRELFNRRGKYGSNFFNDVLEPLFYEALAQDRGKESLYPRLNNCRMPFLNGGLFEPMNGYQWEITNITIPDEMFSNTFKTKEGDEGTGILDVFDRYNFTVNENEPLEKEVAVDPEMLGKVFENLLEINDRKDKGAFYTPREIVHYMCQESLITYLDTNTVDTISKEDIEVFIRKGDRIIENDKIALEKIREKETKGFEYKGRYGLLLPDSIITNAEQLDQLLKNIKVADPAVGSGAFPLGMINEIVRARKVLNIYLDDNVSDYELKLHTISHSIYGVDIDPGAVEIARLRLWLSLVVEEGEPHPLPNLDHKIMQGNSLVSEYEGIRLFDPAILKKYVPDEINPQSLGIGEEEIVPKQDTLGIGEDKSKIKLKELSASIDAYISESQRSKKESLKKEIDQLKWDLIEATLTEKNEVVKLKKVAELRRKNIRPFFIWELEFADVFLAKGGFDVVIGNPPYVGEKGNKEMFQQIRESSLGERFGVGKMDLFYYFFHLGLDLLQDKGFLGFITTNYYPTADGAVKLRKDFYERANIIRLINFGEITVFDSARGQHNLITFLRKAVYPEVDFETEQITTNVKGSIGSDTLSAMLAGESELISISNAQKQNVYDSVGDKYYIRFTSSDGGINKVLEKIAEVGTQLIEFATTNEGIHTGLDSIADKEIRKAPNNGYVHGEGVFVISKGEHDFRHLRPWFKGADIRHYVASKTTSKEVLYWDNNTQPDDDELEHLSRYRELLEDRVAIKRANRPWYQLNWPRKQEIFEGQKIVNPYRSKHNYFALVDDPWYASADVFFTRTNNSDILSNKTLVAILNSKLVFFWLLHRGKRKGDILEIKAVPIGQIPIVIPTENVVGKLNYLTDKIISKIDCDNRADISPEETEINELVMDLYSLDKTEKEIVRKS